LRKKICFGGGDWKNKADLGCELPKGKRGGLSGGGVSAGPFPREEGKEKE